MTRLVTVLTLSLLGLTACGDSSKSVEPAESSAAGQATTTEAAVTTGPISGADCSTVAKEFIRTMLEGMRPGSTTDFEQAFASVEAGVPDELKDDVKVLADGVLGLQTKMKDHPEDSGLLDELKKAFAAPEFKRANDAVIAYFKGNCP